MDSWIKQLDRYINTLGCIFIYVCMYWLIYECQIYIKQVLFYSSIHLFSSINSSIFIYQFIYFHPSNYLFLFFIHLFSSINSSIFIHQFIYFHLFIWLRFDSQGDYGDVSMVDAPKLVDKAALQIGYAKTAKKVDMKRIKNVCWNILTHSAADEKVNFKVILH